MMKNLFNLKRLKKYLSKNPLLYVVVAFITTLAVFFVLLYANLGFLNITGYFEKIDVHKDSILLFFHQDCSYCDNVDVFVKNNAVEQKVPFTRLNVDNVYNRGVLADRVQMCGLDIKTIGVPFLWDGPDKKCVIGYVDIIEFFKGASKRTLIPAKNLPQ